MAFIPFSKRHAIAEVVFALHITPKITHHDRAALRTGHPKWRAFLPKALDYQAVEFSFGTSPEGRPPQPPLPPPLQFVRHKPDGGVDWRLHVSEGDVVVNCLAYTRWHDVWNQARTLFTEVSKILPNGTTVLSVSLQYTNVFSWDKAVKDYDVRRLLNVESERIPAAILSHGPYWHLHQGWFSEVDELPKVRRVLDRMHIDAVDDQAGRHVVKLENLHRLDFIGDALPRLRKAFGAEPASADSYFEYLHERTKESLSDYLAADLQGTLRLHAS